MEPKADLALIGLAVMGQNLILNMNDHGYTIVAYNRTKEKVDEFLANEAKGTKVIGAHSTHVYGLGTYENGIETPRARVTLAMGIPEAECRQINLGYRDPKTINPQDFANREDEGILLVPKAGEMLFHLKQRPAWAREM